MWRGVCGAVYAVWCDVHTLPTLATITVCVCPSAAAPGPPAAWIAQRWRLLTAHLERRASCQFTVFAFYCCCLTRGSTLLATAAARGASRLLRTCRVPPKPMAVPLCFRICTPGLLARSCCSHGSDCRAASDGGGASSGLHTLRVRLSLSLSLSLTRAHTNTHTHAHLYRGGSCPTNRSANSVLEQSALRNRGTSSTFPPALNNKTQPGQRKTEREIERREYQRELRPTNSENSYTARARTQTEREPAMHTCLAQHFPSF